MPLFLRIATTSIIAISPFYIGTLFGAANKSSQNAVMNIYTTTKLLGGSNISATSDSRSDLWIVLESAVLTLGDTRHFIISPRFRRNIDQALVRAGDTLARGPEQQLIVVPSRGQAADTELLSSQHARTQSIIRNARSRLTNYK